MNRLKPNAQFFNKLTERCSLIKITTLLGTLGSGYSEFHCHKGLDLKVLDRLDMIALPKGSVVAATISDATKESLNTILVEATLIKKLSEQG